MPSKDATPKILWRKLLPIATQIRKSFLLGKFPAIHVCIWYMENRTEAKINSSGKLLVVYRNDNTPFSETAARLSPVFSSLSLTPVATSDDIATSVPRTSVSLGTSVPCISDNTSVPRTSVGTVTSFLRVSDGNATSVFLTSAGTVTSIFLTSDCCSCCGWVRSVS